MRHVDDLKVSHGSKKIFTRMLKGPKKTYKGFFEDLSGNMKISVGNIHEYLGTTLDYSETGDVMINMIPYIEEMMK